MRLTNFLPLALVPTLSLAFKHTSPFLVWSSKPNPPLQNVASDVSSGLTPAEDVYRTMSNIGCDWETLVVVHVEELHQSHLSSLSLPFPSADLHIPYLVRPGRQTFDSAIEEWAQVCGAELLDDFEGVGVGKAVIRLSAEKGDDVLSNASTRTPTPDLIILIGSSSSRSLTKRQEILAPSSTSVAAFQTTSSTSRQNTTTPVGPLLDRVQLLTTPIITALLITFGLFVPIIGFGVSALVGIQVPPRMMEISKGMAVGRDRKDQ